MSPDRKKQFLLLYLKCSLFAEAEEPDVVRLSNETTRSVHATPLDWLAPDLRHDVALASQVLVAKGQEVIDDKR